MNTPSAIRYERLRAVKAEIQELEAEAAQLTEELAPLGSITYQTAEGRVSSTVVTSKRYSANIAMIAARAPQYLDRFTRRSVNAAAVREAVEAHAVPAEIAEAISAADSKPYIKFTLIPPGSEEHPDEHTVL